MNSMNWLRRIQLGFRALLGKQKLDAEMDDEMRSHIEMQTQENIEAGMSPEEARYAALRQFGWVESIKDVCREQRGVSWIENLGQDIRYGARMLRKNSSFAAAAVVTFALGIGATSAVFSLVQGVLLTPPPYFKPEQIVLISSIRKTGEPYSKGCAATQWQEWRTEAKSFTEMAGYGWTLNPACSCASRPCHQTRLSGCRLRPHKDAGNHEAATSRADANQNRERIDGWHATLDEADEQHLVGGVGGYFARALFIRREDSSGCGEEGQSG